MIEYINFPDVNNAGQDGLLAMGGNLSVNSLISAYKQGIFPWFNQGQPTLWWSPDPRLVLFPDQVKISRSLAKLIRQQRFQISCNQAFSDVINHCAGKRFGRDNNETWITNEMHQAYCELHHRGYAHSIEIWQQQNLVGGLYGIALGKAFFGESMFSHVSNASKIALVSLCRSLSAQQFQIIDCQVASNHLITMGAVEIQRANFLEYLKGIDIQKPHHTFAEYIELATT